MRMKSVLAGLAALALSATTAEAAVVFNVGDSSSLTHTVTLDGNIDGTFIPELSAEYIFWLVSTDTTNGTWVIGMSVENTTDTSGGAWSNVTTFGMDIDPNIGASGTSSDSTIFDKMVFNGSLNQFGSIEFCVFDGNNDNNCNNATGGGGLDPTDAAHTFELTLQIADSANYGSTSLTFDNFAVRYQSICLAGSGASIPDGCEFSGTGGLIPEPATWIMMIVGFAGMGTALKYRRRREYGALAA